MDKVGFVNLLGSQISCYDNMLKSKWLNEIQLRYVATVTLYMHYETSLVMAVLLYSWTWS